MADCGCLENSYPKKIRVRGSNPRGSVSTEREEDSKGARTRRRYEECMMYYEEVFKTFRRWRVKYLIAGGMAVNLYGIPRFTKDLDILIETSSPNLNRLKKALESLGYRPKVPVTLEAFLIPGNWKKWKKEKGMVAFNLYRPDQPFAEIDLLIGTTLQFHEAASSSFAVSAGKLRLNLVGIDDLIKMKREAGRERDLSDIKSLKKLKKSGILKIKKDQRR